jgi:hypothetical protein
MSDFQVKLDQLRVHARDCARSDHPERELLGKLSERLGELIADLESIIADLNGREI